jgi:hypothetical protein
MPLRLDLGPRWESQGIADLVPPAAGPAYRTLVPAVDADGNEVAGIRLPEIAVPLATYTGWNLRAAPYGAEGMLGRWTGSYFPFCRTAEERRRGNDPRRAVVERYPAPADYLGRVADAAGRLRREGFLLDEDAEAIRRAAAGRRLWETR